MKKLVMVLVILISSMVWATEVQVKPGIDMLGWSNFSTANDYTTLTNSGWTTLGNNNDEICNYVTVIKFSLADFTNTTESATLSFWQFYATTGVYIQLQHTTQETAGAAVRHADVVGLTYENIGSPRKFYSLESTGFDYDITSAINADIAAGYDYITFLVKAVDSLGNLVGANSYGCIDSEALNPFAAPVINAVLVPEPTTMALLMIGGLMIRRMKKN